MDDFFGGQIMENPILEMDDSWRYMLGDTSIMGS